MTKGIKSEKGKRGEEVELLKVNRIKFIIGSIFLTLFLNTGVIFVIIHIHFN